MGLLFVFVFFPSGLLECKNGETHNYGLFLKWGYPEIIHVNGIFYYKPSIVGYPLLGKPSYFNICLKPSAGALVGSGRCKTCESLRTSCMRQPESAALRFHVELAPCCLFCLMGFNGIYLEVLKMGDPQVTIGFNTKMV